MTTVKKSIKKSPSDTKKAMPNVTIKVKAVAKVKVGTKPKKGK